MRSSSISYFLSSFFVLALAIPLGYLIGGLPGAWTVAVLAVLETSLSFDNAVVNAAVLGGWNQAWRRLFLWVGLPIAVFGMRLVFPILVVSLTTGLGMMQAFWLALESPADYARALTSAHHYVAAFGGTFLLMVAFEFFIDAEKEHHWLPGIERLFAKLATYQKMVGAGIALSVLMLASLMVHGEAQQQFIVAGILGFLVYVGTKFLGELLSGGDAGVGVKVAQGIGGLLYLEILDASFSFDGVIGAFAITNQLFLIMLGLGVGAMFVRSLTIYLVDKGTLAEYRYLEHGAFWAILVLAGIMFLGVRVEIPEVVTGFLGAGLIGLALWSSVRANQHDARKLSTR